LQSSFFEIIVLVVMESQVFDNQKISMDSQPLVKHYVGNITSVDGFNSVFKLGSDAVYE
jgi:hypothetical protein